MNTASRDMNRDINIQPNGREVLQDLERGEMAVIDDVPDHSLLAPLGVRPGKEVLIKSKQPFKGPVVLEIEGRQVAVDRNIAGKITVNSGADTDAGN